MRLRPAHLLLAACLLATPALHAQVQRTQPSTTTVSDDDSTGTVDESGEDLMGLLDDQPQGPNYASATFKTTRLINGHTVENVGKGVLDFKILHRFGMLNQGVKDFFGLDNAVTKLAFDYGVTDWLMIGIGRSGFEKEYDGYFKAKLFRQRQGRGLPVTLSYMGGISIRTLDAIQLEPNLKPGQEYFISNRLFYVNQLLIARKFNQWLSLQIMPTHVHFNLVPTAAEKNDVLAIGFGGRLKVSRRISITGEWYYTLPGYKLNGYRNALSLGVDIETGGHVFQLLFTNSTGVTERNFIGQTTGDWANGDVRFGFNISRVFTIVKPKGFEGSRNQIN